MSGLLTVYDVACPFCGSDAGAPCFTSPAARERHFPHALRVNAFRRAVLKSDTGGSE